jgi:hypothetical protein
MGKEVKFLKQRYVGLNIRWWTGSIVKIVDIYAFRGNYYFQVLLQITTSYHMDWQEIRKEILTYFNVEIY